jgi:hypothetical protein
VGILYISILCLLQNISGRFLKGGKLTHKLIMEVFDEIPSEPESATSDASSETEDAITDLSDILPVQKI